MGGIMSKAGEWTEVVTGNSPGSPEDTENVQRLSNNELAKRRILQVDPRYILSCLY